MAGLGTTAKKGRTMVPISTVLYYGKRFTQMNSSSFDLNTKKLFIMDVIREHMDTYWIDKLDCEI